MGGLGKTSFNHSLHKKIMELYCVQSAEETPVNRSRPCPCRAYLLLRETDNKKANEANNETVVICEGSK